MKAVVAAFNQESALVETFSVITNLRMELFEALYTTVTAVAGNPAPAISVFNKPLEKGQLSPLPRYKAITVQRDAGDYQLLMR